MTGLEKGLTIVVVILSSVITCGLAYIIYDRKKHKIHRKSIKDSIKANKYVAKVLKK